MDTGVLRGENAGNPLQGVSSASVKPPVCRESDGMFAAAEIALEGGLERCYVVDAAGRLLGEVTLEDARRAIRSGAYRQPLTAGMLMRERKSVV